MEQIDDKQLTRGRQEARDGGVKEAFIVAENMTAARLV